MIINSKYNNNFYLKKNFHPFVPVNNQDISDVEKKIKQHFSVGYTKYIFVHLAS